MFELKPIFTTNKYGSLKQPGQLERSLSPLHPSVHRKQAIVAKHLAGKLLKFAQAVVVEGTTEEQFLGF